MPEPKDLVGKRIVRVLVESLDVQEGFMRLDTDDKLTFVIRWKGQRITVAEVSHE